MRGMTRARAGLALAAAVVVLAGCGGQGSSGVSSSGGAQSDGPGQVAAGDGARTGDAPGGTDSASGTTDSAPGATGSGDRAVSKPPRGAYDDTSGTRTGKPRSQRAVLDHLPGPSRSTCVAVGARSVLRSGPVGMGSFSQARSVFARARTPYNAAPSFFYVIPHSRTATAATVVASRPGTRVPPVTVHTRQLESAAQWHYFPVHLQIPSRGTWRFQVTVGSERGCFVARFT